MRIILPAGLILVFYFALISYSSALTAFDTSTNASINVPQADERFAFDLYSRLASSDNGNIFFSPYSLSSALEMVYEGARGMTALEMSSVLHLNADNIARRAEVATFIQKLNAPDKPCELSVANALWAQDAFPFKKDYLSLIKNTYFAEARNMDFVRSPEPSRQTINAWVSEKTRDRINDLLPHGSITADTSLVITNAVYFKGKWETPFKKENTKKDAFWITPDKTVQTDMMTLEWESFNYMENDQVQILKLPYEGNDLSMIIILPRSKDIHGIERILTQAVLSKWQEGIYSQKVDVVLPKFKFDAAYEMKNILTELGMKRAFDPGQADFSGVVDKVSGKNLLISGVYHKAWIDTNEEGTEAAAATAIVMSAMGRAVDIEPKVFRADHPFIFLIQDDSTGHILFMGRVSDPRKE